MINRRKHLFFAALVVLLGGASSCTKDFKSINTPLIGSPIASVAQLYVAFVSNMTQGDQQVGNNSWVYPITQLAPVYTKADYSYGNDGDEYWSNFYHNLPNYRVDDAADRSATGYDDLYECEVHDESAERIYGDQADQLLR